MRAGATRDGRSSTTLRVLAGAARPKAIAEAEQYRRAALWEGRFSTDVRERHSIAACVGRCRRVVIIVPASTAACTATASDCFAAAAASS